MGIAGACMVPHPPLIIPDVGRGEEKAIGKTIEAYHEAAKRIAALKPETIFIVSPHSVMYRDYIHISPGENASGDFGRFRAPGVKISVRYDRELRDELVRLAGSEGLPAGTEGDRNADPELDHATMIPLWFLNHYYTDYKIIRCGISGLPFSMHYELGRKVAEAAEKTGRRTVFIASGDLSHCLKEDGPYGYRKEGPEYDRRIMEIMGKGDFRSLLKLDEDFCDHAGECGQRGFCMMAGALENLPFRAEKLSYEGPFGVGYGIVFYSLESGGAN